MADNEIEQGLEGVAAAAGEVADAATAAGIATGASPAQAAAPKKQNSRTLDFLMDVSLQVSVEVGRARMTINDLLQMGAGSVVELEKLAGEPLDIFINGKPVARGEAVIVNEKFGVRLTDIISPEERVEGMA
ncbi:MAG: flagellar motor switch protein FliN [Pseudomonadota bacterium]|jgi:flagellar motor switch protein FliN/FliY